MAATGRPMTEWSEGKNLKHKKTRFFAALSMTKKLGTGKMPVPLFFL
jgi:hypothetical protein